MRKYAKLIIGITMVVSLSAITTYASLKIQSNTKFISLLTLANIEALSNWEWPGEGEEWLPQEGYGKIGTYHRCTINVGDGSYISSVGWDCEIAYNCPSCTCIPTECHYE